MNIKFFDKFIQWSSAVENKRKYTILTIIFAPIFFFIHKKECKFFWEIILNEIGEKDEIVKFLDKNEFGLVPNKIYKKDVIDDNSDLIAHSTENLKLLIFREFSDNLMDLFKKHCTIDIENYISLLVDVQLYRKDNSLLKLYTVSIVYYRLNLYLGMKSIMVWWCSIVSMALIILYLLLNYI